MEEKNEDEAPPSQGLYIAQWRKFRRLSTRQLADRIARIDRDGEGLSHASITRIETNGQAFTGRTLRLIARALDTTPGALLSRPPWRDEELLKAWRRLDAAGRDTVVGVLHALARDCPPR